MDVRVSLRSVSLVTYEYYVNRPLDQRLSTLGPVCFMQFAVFFLYYYCHMLVTGHRV
jgi:hypothetical protein